jgi:hypothetical protein
MRNYFTNLRINSKSVLNLKLKSYNNEEILLTNDGNVCDYCS